MPPSGGSFMRDLQGSFYFYNTCSIIVLVYISCFFCVMREKRERVE